MDRSYDLALTKNVQRVGVLAAVSGFVLSIYAYVHQTNVAVLGRTDFPCNISQYLSCDRVALSEYSRLFDVPQGFWGMTFFGISLLVLFLPLFSKGKIRVSWLAMLAFSTVGALYCLRLFLLTVFKIEALCITCIGAHISCYVVFAVSATGARRAPLPPLRELRALAIIAASAIAILIAYPRVGPQLYLAIEAMEPELSFGHLTHLTTPVSGPAETARPWNPILGPDNAPKVLVEFVDYTCSACSSFMTVIKRYNAAYPGQLKVVLKNFPQDVECNPTFWTSPHPNACLAAYAAQCAWEAGMFHKFYDVIFTKTKFLLEDMQDLLVRIGVSAEAAAACLVSEQTRMAVKQDVQEGTSIGVKATPALVARGALYQSELSLQILSLIVGKIAL